MTGSSPALPVSRAEFIAIIAAMMAMNALAVDIVLPALPFIGATFALPDANQPQLVIGTYMLGMGIGQIGFGPVSDRYGRKMPLLIGMGFYVLAALVAIFSPSFGALLLFRLMQGLGSAAARVIAISIVRDQFEGRAMAEIMSLAFMVFMIVPIIAPALGQVILLAGPWQYVFAFMAVVAAIVTGWAMLRLPETLVPEKRRPLTFTSVAQGFGLVFSNRSAMSYCVAGVCQYGALFGFITTVQQIYVGIFGLGQWFALAFAAVALLMSVASFLNARMVMHFGMRRMSHFAILMFVGMSGLLLALSLAGPVSFWTFFVLISLIMFSFGWSSSNMNALAMEPLGAVAGTASSVFGFLQTVGGAVLGTYIGQHFDGTVRPVAAGYFILGVIALGACLMAEKGRLFGVGSR